MQSDRTIQAGAKTLTIRFGHNGIAFIEDQLCKMHRDGTLEKAVVDGEALPITIFDLFRLPRWTGTRLGLWAGLESARRKYHSRKEPYSMDEVGELLDDCELVEVEKTVGECLRAALPKMEPQQEGIEQTAADAKNGQEETAPTGMPGSSNP